jgi:hypothetical protein
MASKSESKKGKPSSAGKSSGKINAYWSVKHQINMSMRAMRLYNRVLKLTGNESLAMSEAMRCAEKHGVIARFKELLNKG